jgi:hypothetical protein
MDELLTRAFTYILSLSVVTTILIYILDLPGYLTGAHDLVKIYYYQNAVYSFLLDIVLVAIYISAAMYVTSAFNIKGNAKELITLSGVTAVISTIFMLIFQTGIAKGTFFHKWFERVGTIAVLYDVILVTSVFFLMKIIYNRF